MKHPASVGCRCRIGNSRRWRFVRFHPGAILEEEFRQPFGLSARALAKAISMPGNRFTALIHGERTITADTALRLGRFFDMSPEFWLGQQMGYDLEAARTSLGERLEQEVTPRDA